MSSHRETESKGVQTTVVGMKIAEFIKKAVKQGKEPRRREHDALLLLTPSVYRFTANKERNRFNNVICYDHSSVVLKAERPGGGDYIHANWVNAQDFILTQAPIEEEGRDTVVDSWRMVWQENVCVIVCLCKEPVKEESAAYWPQLAGKKLKVGEGSGS